MSSASSSNHDHTASAHDSHPPAEMARLVESVGVSKARLPLLDLWVLGMLAGAFIAFGGMLFTLVITGGDPGVGLTRWAGGIAFSLGLVLVVVGGAELFTGNNLIVMAWAGGYVSTPALLRNWAVVYVANLVGSLGSVALVWASGILEAGDGAFGRTAAAIARTKLDTGLLESFSRGVLCNALVCLAVWLCFACRDVAGKVLCIVFPVSAFVALGFEHSIANMYLIPVGMLAAGTGIDGAAMAANLIPVTLGNVVGGSALVALTYWVVYLRRARSA